MDKRLTYKMLRENWYLVVLCLFFLGLGLHGFRSESSNPEAHKKADFKVKRYVQEGSFIKKEKPVRLSPQERTRNTIAQHEQKLAEENLAPDDAAAYMNAVGNLHMQRLHEYQEAAEQFELLLSKYPNWSGAGGVYTKLAVCYERLEDEAQAQQVYMRMRSAFPADSQEHQMATQELGLKD